MAVSLSIRFSMNAHAAANSGLRHVERLECRELAQCRDLCIVEYGKRNWVTIVTRHDKLSPYATSTWIARHCLFASPGVEACAGSPEGPSIGVFLPIQQALV